MTEETTEITPQTADDREIMEQVQSLIDQAAEASAGAVDGDMSWLPEWYLGNLAQLDALEDRVKDQARIILHQLEARRKALQWKWGLEFQSQVHRDIAAQPGKRKSVDYLTGRAGLRAVGGQDSVVVDDPEKAFEAANAVCPGAVTIEFNKKALRDFAKIHGHSLLGTHIETAAKTDKFYPWIDAAPKLEGMVVKQIEEKPPMTAKEFFDSKPVQEAGASVAGDEVPFE